MVAVAAAAWYGPDHGAAVPAAELLLSAWALPTHNRTLAGTALFYRIAEARPSAGIRRLATRPVQFPCARAIVVKWVVVSVNLIVGVR